MCKGKRGNRGQRPQLRQRSVKGSLRESDSLKEPFTDVGALVPRVKREPG